MTIPTARDALQAIADLPTPDNLERMAGHEDAYRAVEKLFATPPHIVQTTDIVAEVQNVIHEAILSNDRVGRAYERIIQALFDSYDVFQASHLVDRARLEHVIRIALVNAAHGSRPREVVAEALFNHFKLVPKRT